MVDSQAGRKSGCRGSLLAASTDASCASSPAKGQVGALSKENCSGVRVELPCDYALPASSVRILANLLIAAVQSPDRPSEVA